MNKNQIINLLIESLDKSATIERCLKDIRRYQDEQKRLIIENTTLKAELGMIEQTKPEVKEWEEHMDREMGLLHNTQPSTHSRTHYTAPYQTTHIA